MSLISIENFISPFLLIPLQNTLTTQNINIFSFKNHIPQHTKLLDLLKNESSSMNVKKDPLIIFGKNIDF
jgi:hypothetical protein